MNRTALLLLAFLASCAFITPSDWYVGNAADCDDGDVGVHPGAEDAPGDSVDRDCDGEDG